MNFELINLNELIHMRMEARLNKDWQFSDEIRNYLDSKYVFIFDTKDNEGKPFQDVYWLPKSYFNLDEVYTYTKMTPEFSETKRQKIERLNGIKIETNRKYLEYRIKRDIRAEQNYKAWLFTTKNKQ